MTRHCPVASLRLVVVAELLSVRMCGRAVSPARIVGPEVSLANPELLYLIMMAMATTCDWR